MRLLGFNTGVIRPQAIDGEVVRTAYVKTPAPEPWTITPTGALGDQVAVHTDHLYAFDRDGYDYWAAELGVDRAEWADGHFAENLTVDAIDQSELRVGDRFRLGEAVLVVTGPRVPCWKLTWRLGQPKTFMRRFRLSGRSGSYLGVIEPGIVRPGDEFVLLGRDESMPSVGELSALCDSGTRITEGQRATIDRALACADLSETVRATLTLKLAGLDREAHTAAGAWRGWRRFEIESATAETTESTSFSLRPTDGGPLPEFRAGQHVVVRLTEPGSRPVVRTWSLSDWAPQPDRYRIAVKILPDGLGGTALVRGATSRASIELRTPSGQFALDRGSFRPVILVAAGIGVTPMIAMAKAHVARTEHVPPLWLLYGTPDPERTAFRSELDEVFAAHEDLQLHYFHTRSPAGESDAGARRTIHAGRITAERVLEVLRGNYLRLPDGAQALIPWFESDVYICGPADFNAAIESGLIAAGANPDHVFTEDFVVSTGELAGPSRREDAVVDFGSRGLTAVWKSAEEQTLLELAEDRGLELPYDCRAGTCRTCESRLVCGDVDGSVTIAEDGSRRVLLCVSYPLSDRVGVEPPDA